MCFVDAQRGVWGRAHTGAIVQANIPYMQKYMTFSDIPDAQVVYCVALLSRHVACYYSELQSVEIVFAAYPESKFN